MQTFSIRSGLLILGLAAVACARADVPAKATPDAPFLAIKSHDVQSSEGKTYRIIVAPPSGPAPAAGYPVVYVIDGNAWAPMVAEIIKVNTFFSTISKTEPSVVVGIGYPTELPFDMSRRYHDLTTSTTMPNPMERLMPGEPGGYEAMASFIERKVKPDIERRYKIDRQRQTIMGHSLGGLFVLRTLLNHPDTFQSYAALSPSIWWNYATLLKEMNKLELGARAKGTRVYVGIGDLEQHMTPSYKMEFEGMLRAMAKTDPQMLKGRTFEAFSKDMNEYMATVRMVDNAREMAALLKKKGLTVHFDSFPEEDHSSSVPSQMGRAIPFVLKH